jgi:hypothetical protein
MEATLILLTVVFTPYRVYPTSPLTASGGRRVEGARMSFAKGIKTIATDSHFLVPFVVLLAGIALLVALH